MAYTFGSMAQDASRPGMGSRAGGFVRSRYGGWVPRDHPDAAPDGVQGGPGPILDGPDEAGGELPSGGGVMGGPPPMFNAEVPEPGDRDFVHQAQQPQGGGNFGGGGDFAGGEAPEPGDPGYGSDFAGGGGYEAPEPGDSGYGGDFARGGGGGYEVPEPGDPGYGGGGGDFRSSGGSEVPEPGDPGYGGDIAKADQPTGRYAYDDGGYNVPGVAGGSYNPTTGQWRGGGGEALSDYGQPQVQSERQDQPNYQPPQFPTGPMKPIPNDQWNDFDQQRQAGRFGGYGGQPTSGSATLGTLAAASGASRSGGSAFGGAMGGAFGGAGRAAGGAVKGMFGFGGGGSRQSPGLVGQFMKKRRPQSFGALATSGAAPQPSMTPQGSVPERAW